jgi:hypothetical protein
VAGGKCAQHAILAMFSQSVFSRLAGLRILESRSEQDFTEQEKVA